MTYCWVRRHEGKAREAAGMLSFQFIHIEQTSLFLPLDMAVTLELWKWKDVENCPRGYAYIEDDTAMLNPNHHIVMYLFIIT